MTQQERFFKLADVIDELVLNLTRMANRLREPTCTKQEAFAELYTIRRELGYVVRCVDTRTEIR